jgi:ATP-binding cassette, subfamily B, bacterial PglK
MVGIIRKIWSLLDSRERRRALIVFGLLVVVAFVDVLGVASVMPFIAVLANPDVVESNRHLAAVYSALGFESRETFLFALGFLFFTLLVSSLVLRAIGLWAQLRFSQNREWAWGSRLVGGYLRQPYEWFLNRHSADLATAVLAEVRQVINGALFPAMRLIAHVLLAGLLMILLIVIDPVLAIAAGGVLGGSYLAISMVLRRRLERIGAERMQANRARFHVVQGAFGGIKDLKIKGLEEISGRSFSHPRPDPGQPPDLGGAHRGAAFVCHAGTSFWRCDAAPSVPDGYPWRVPGGAAGDRGVRLRRLPADARIADHLSGSVANAVLRGSAGLPVHGFRIAADRAPWRGRHARAGNRERLPLLETLVLEDVVYGYPGAARNAVDQLSMEIPACSTVGLVGSTGSGKTTTVDLILGLLRPNAGRIVIDGQELTDDRVRLWQRSLGYVPQQIFLSDDTVAGNIAFGLPENRIDMAAVERAARIANLHDFVVNELPKGYQTTVGERGVRLSGGQRQRIGIARALYHDPDVLILDEATSALDNLTEQAVMEAVHNLGSHKTIILIAHRLTTVRNCDRIFLLERGSLVGVRNL